MYISLIACRAGRSRRPSSIIAAGTWRKAESAKLKAQRNVTAVGSHITHAHRGVQRARADNLNPADRGGRARSNHRHPSPPVCPGNAPRRGTVGSRQWRTCGLETHACDRTVDSGGDDRRIRSHGQARDGPDPAAQCTEGRANYRAASSAVRGRQLPAFLRPAREPASALDGHDPAEFLVADLAISIRVRLSDHGVDLRVWDVLPHAAKGSEHLLELLLVDLA